MWWIIGLWVGASFLLAVGVALGGALGYRRGWEDHRASLDGHDSRGGRSTAIRGLAK